MPTWILLAMPWLLAPACSQADGGAAEEGAHEVLYSDANLASLEVELWVETVPLQAREDVLIDWSDLTVDALGRPVVASEISEVVLAAFSIPAAEILDGLVAYDLGASDIRDYRSFTSDGARTQALLSEFSIQGNDFVPESDFLVHDDTVWTWAIALRQEVDGLTILRAGAFLEPVEAGGASALPIGNSSSGAALSLDLAAAEPLVVPAAPAAVVLDWSAASLDVIGTSYWLPADRLSLAHHAGTFDEVEADPVAAWDQADAVYEADVWGLTQLELSTLAERSSGQAFPGFSDDGSWVLGMSLSDAFMPRPIVLAPIQVE